MKKVLFFVLAALVIVACDEVGGPSKIESISLTPSLEMVEGSSQRLTLTTNPENAEYVAIWESTDSNTVYVDSVGEVYALAVGEATITVKIQDTDLSAACKITVVDYLSSIVFDKAALFDLDEVNTFKANVMRPDQEDSILMDCYNVTYGVVANTMYFDGEGMLAGENGMVMFVPTSFAFDSQYWYCLGEYFIDEAPFNADNNLTPHHALRGEFEEDVYAEFWTLNMIAETEDQYPNPDDYEYYSEKSSYIINTFASDQGLNMLDGGFPEQGIFELDQHPTDNLLFTIPFYEIDAKVFGERFNAGLATQVVTDSVSGEEYLAFVDKDEDGIFDMDTISSYLFKNGQPTEPEAAPTKSIQVRGAIKASVGRKMLSMNRMTNIAIVMNLDNKKYRR